MIRLYESLIQAKIRQSSPLLKQHYSDEQLYQQASNELAEDVERLTSNELAEIFYQYAPVANVDASAYKTRMLSIDSNEILCGIRFRGMDLSRPFVNIAVTTETLTKATINKVVEQVSQDFRAFSPQYVQFYISSHLAINAEDFDNAHWDYRVLANALTLLVNNISKDDSIINQPRYSLILTDDLEFYPEYEQAYKDLFDKNPDHKEMTELKAIENMTEWLAQGLIFLLKVDTALAGIMIVERDNSLGMTGFYVNENLVFNHYRGLGAWMQQAVIQQLANQPNKRASDMLFGTIHNDNIAAINCAKRMGRQDIGGYLWVATDIR